MDNRTSSNSVKDNRSTTSNGKHVVLRNSRQPPSPGKHPAVSRRKLSAREISFFRWVLRFGFASSLFLILMLLMLQVLRKKPIIHHKHEATVPSQYNSMAAVTLHPVWDYMNDPLSIPIGEPPISLGTNKTGVAEKDLHYAASPKVWKLLVNEYNIHSVLTVHCGRGLSTAWFLQHGVEALCIEGNLQNLQDSVLNDVVMHDYMAGPWWPAATYDAAWVVNLLEHIPTYLMHHYIATLKKAAVIFATTGSSSDQSSEEGHIEVHDDAWWISKMSLFGFVHDDSITRQVRGRAATEDCYIGLTEDNGEGCQAESLQQEMLVFLNPAVAALPQHAHLFFQHGCISGRNGAGQLQHRPCGSDSNSLETPLPDTFLQPIPLNSTQDGAWRTLVKEKLAQRASSAPAKTKSQMSPDPVITQADRKRQKEEAAQNELLQRIATGNMTALPKITVVAWPYLEHGIQTAEHIHLSKIGINDSPYLRLAKNMTDYGPDHNPQHVVWAADTGNGMEWNLWCDRLLQRLVAAREHRVETKNNYPLSWPLYIVDFTDAENRQRCRKIEDFMGKEFVFYSKRSFATGRQWDDSKKWVKVGQKMPVNDSGVVYQHSPLFVRTDTIHNLNNILTKQRGLKLHDPIERLIPRTVDVSHFWPQDKQNVSNNIANLRNTVTDIVAELGRPPHTLNVFVGLKGAAVSQGRRGVKDEYIHALLDSKIVVVSQRDEWEDHYRLFEAFAGGAMVMTDFMHSLPAGLQNGTSLIEYASAEQLEALILYYVAHDEERIAIARKGREVAMSRHRAWHRMEEIIFGQVVSVCTSQDPHRKCPYIVHGNEKDT